ncbi:hypothetical protein FNJ88_03920 [Chryseobacterium sp. SNU WT5]|uniref:hypothetical protein n=1 Tax=Chryseobacterium sp. SNU WT5 TaxID=2594269 RepID=UPI00117E42A1|nr:hypothetical protein [Chryseobacterium sp. SNU WT5]QDP84738.1 hypothetical protein FNJ88_03920 [Chryseobacterium sp. SNU WT5]
MDTDKKYVKAKIEGVFNIEEFSKEYEMTPKEVVDFHNSHCNLQELLTLTLPKYVKYVYVPQKNYKDRNRQLLKSTILDLPTNNSEKTYGVIIKFLPKELQMHYEIKIKRTSLSLQLSKGQTNVNNQTIDQTIEQLFEKAEQVLYPLEIARDGNGSLLNILNTGEIAKRWKNECRPKLKEYYQSTTTDELLQKLDQAIFNIQEKRALLERNVFYKLFFLPIYQSYPSFLKDDVLQIYFSSIGQEVTYNINYQLEKEFTTTDKIVLQLSGREEESFFNKNREKGRVDLSYKLHKDTQEISSITGALSVFEKDQKFQLDFQLYELENS